METDWKEDGHIIHTANYATKNYLQLFDMLSFIYEINITHLAITENKRATWSQTYRDICEIHMWDLAQIPSTWRVPRSLVLVRGYGRVREQVDDHAAFPQHASTASALWSYPTVHEFYTTSCVRSHSSFIKVLGSCLSVTSLSLRAIKSIVRPPASHPVL